MEYILSREMKADLLQVNSIFKENLAPWWDEIKVFVHKLDEDESFQLIPAMVIYAYRQLGLERKLSLQMANLFKTLYFASKIHVLIKDDEEGQEQNQEMQFAILIGDYIFGKVLSLLLELRVDRLLDMFAAMICEINEGLILQYKLNGGLIEVLSRTKAPLYSNTFRSAAQLAGLSDERVIIYDEIGYNLGMGVELMLVCEQKEDQSYLDRAEQLIKKFQENMNLSESSLQELVHKIRR